MTQYKKEGIFLKKVVFKQSSIIIDGKKYWLKIFFIKIGKTMIWNKYIMIIYYQLIYPMMSYFKKIDFKYMLCQHNMDLIINC